MSLPWRVQPGATYDGATQARKYLADASHLSGNLNNDRDCEKQQECQLFDAVTPLFILSLTNFHVTTIAESTNKDISIPKPDNKLHMPTTSWPPKCEQKL